MQQFGNVWYSLWDLQSSMLIDTGDSIYKWDFNDILCGLWLTCYEVLQGTILSVQLRGAWTMTSESKETNIMLFNVIFPSQ